MRYAIKAYVGPGRANEWAAALAALGWHIVSEGREWVYATIEAPRREEAVRYANAVFEADFGTITGIRWVSL